MGGEIEQSDVIYYGDSVAAGGEQHIDTVRMLRRAIRGRMLIAVVLMLALGSIGAIGGFQSADLVYRSVAQVYVRPNLKPILNPSDTSQIPPMFSSYVRAQVSLVQSPDTLRLARDKLITQASDATGQERLSIMDVATPIAIRDGLRVVHRPGEEVIDVWFIHKDPVAAEAATNAVLDAFKTKHEERRKKGDEFRIETLTNLARNAELSAGAAEGEINRIGTKYGTTDLSLQHQRLVESRSRLRARAEALQHQIAQTESRDADGTESIVDQDASDLVLLAQDPELETLRAARDAKEAEIESYRGRLGPNHMVMRRLRGELAALDSRLEARRTHVRMLIATGGAGDGLTLEASLPSLRRMLEATNELLAQADDEIRDVFVDEAALRQLRRDLANARSKQEEAQAALDRVMLDEIVSERVGFIQTTLASTPSYPYSDRRKAYALLGGGGGAGLGLAVVLGWGLLNRKYNYIEDLKEPSFTAPLLGCLPDLRDLRGGKDEVTAWSIHQIRNLLQAKVGERDGRGNLYAITSPQSGDGKTSLALALAISMAKSGKKTVLVDLDLIGRGLTKQLKLEGSKGIRETILNECVNGEVQSTEVDGLSVIPAGLDESVDDSNLSSSRLRQIMAPLTEQFDAVILDTGPVLGSLESSLACGLADGVLVTISRGQNESLVESSLQRIRWLGADCIGLVFNRATQRDLRRSHSYSASMSRPSASGPNEQNRSRRAVLASAVGEQDTLRVLGPPASAKRKRRRRK